MAHHTYRFEQEITKDVLNRPPHWLVRWGVTIFCAVFILILVFSWVFQFPDIINGKITITSQAPPVKLIAQTQGRITLLVKDNEAVATNQYLAVIENPASIEDITLLHSLLYSLQNQQDSNIESLTLSLPNNLKLGDIVDDYSKLQSAYSELRFFLQTNYVERQIRSYKEQIQTQHTLQEKLNEQQSIKKRELEIAQHQFENQQSLYAKGFISRNDLDKAENEMLVKKDAVHEIETQILNTQLSLSEYQKQINELTLRANESSHLYILKLQEALVSVQHSLNVWERRYILKSPINGIASFFNYWTNEQFVSAGDEIMAVVAPVQNLVGKMYVTQIGSSKIHIGQPVKIRFDASPSQEYGIVQGTIQSISLIPHDDRFCVTVDFPNSLKTSYNKTLDFKDGMQGRAEILTDNLRLIERIFYRLRLDT